MNILVLAGGDSDERAVSLSSGQAVTRGLQEAGHQVTQYDPSGSRGDLMRTAIHYDVVFPALHGKGGEDGTIQALLESNNIAFVGSSAAASKLCFDKHAYQSFLKDKGYAYIRGAMVTKDSLQGHPLLERPFVLKPNDGGSSIDTFIVRDVAQIPTTAIDAAFTRHATMLLEELITGTETTVAVLGDNALPVIEIIPPSNEEFDYNNKYNGKTEELCPPKSLSPEIQVSLQQFAHTIHIETGCRDMSRTDIIVSDDGRLVPLETNTIPGLTDQSLLPKAAAEAGYTMAELCDTLVKAAWSRTQ